MTIQNSEHWWMPFTNHRLFRENPRFFTRADGCFLYTDDNRDILDITACLWCMNLGHRRERVAEAVHKQLLELDYSLAFQFGHPGALQFSERICAYTPDGVDKVFYSNDGSGAVDTALKIATSYWRARGQAGKNRFVSRFDAYHGINIGGTSLQGLPNNRKGFPTLENIDFLPTLLDIDNNAFTRGLPQQGVEKADALLEIIRLRGAETIAAVIIEPVVGAGGVIPPPQGYLQRLRDICNQHDILLICDEVVTGFGRVGAAFASNRFEITPDMMTCAKGISGGFIPLGATFCKNEIFTTIIDAAPANTVEFFHGTTYSAHPAAIAAASACLDIYEEENLFTRAKGDIGEYWENTLHSLKDIPQLIDIRNIGLLGAITFAPQPERFPNGIGPTVHQQCFRNGLLCRGVGNHMVMSPPLIISEQEIDLFVERLRRSINEVL